MRPYQNINFITKLGPPFQTFPHNIVTKGLRVQGVPVPTESQDIFVKVLEFVATLVLDVDLKVSSQHALE